MEETILLKFLELTEALRAMNYTFDISVNLENSHIRFSSKDEDEDSLAKSKKSVQLRRKWNKDEDEDTLAKRKKSVQLRKRWKKCKERLTDSNGLKVIEEYVSNRR